MAAAFTIIVCIHIVVMVVALLCAMTDTEFDVGTPFFLALLIGEWTTGLLAAWG